MPRKPFPSAILFFSVLALGCQGEPNVPSEPGRGIDLAAPGGCLNTEFSAASAVYTNSQVQNAKLKACKTIEAFVKRNQIGKAELEIDKLLVAIHSDYQDGTAALAPVAPNTLEQSVANYIGAACGLAPLDDSDCLVPNDLDNDGIDAEDLDGWIAAGPLSGTATALATGLLENALFAFGVEGGPAYVTVAQRPATGVDGPCPEEFAFDCEDDVFDVDVDGVSPIWVTVESCTTFGKKHAHCPEGQPCAFGETTTPLLLINESACTNLGYNEMGLLGKFAYQATKPAQWVIHATPAYAGTSTKFGAFSPIVAADDLPRTRGVDCIVSTSQFSSGSAGSTCRLLNGTTQIAECVTVATGEKSSRCTLSPPIPDDIIVLVTIAKTENNGIYNATSAPFGIGPANPARGEDNKQVCFDMSPPAQQVNCP